MNAKGPGVTASMYDDSGWPLFRIVLPKTDLNDDEFMAFVTTLDELPRRGGKFAVLLDARAAPPPAARRRKILGEHGNASFARHPGAMVGMAIVLSSALQRGVFTAVHWLTRQPDIVRPFGAVADAEAWLEMRLRESGARARVASGA